MTGTYMDVIFSDASNEKLNSIIESFGLKKDFTDKFHCTITYSKKPLPKLTTYGGIAQDEEGNASEPIEKIAKIKGFGHFDTDDGKNLHVKLECPWCEEEFQRSKNAGATSDYPEYIAHATLMYNCGDFTYSDEMGQEFIGMDIEIIEERISPLNENWVQEKTDTNSEDDTKDAIIEATMYGSMSTSILLEDSNDVTYCAPVDAILESTTYGANVELDLYDL